MADQVNGKGLDIPDKEPFHYLFDKAWEMANQQAPVGDQLKNLVKSFFFAGASAAIAMGQRYSTLPEMLAIIKLDEMAEEVQRGIEETL